ncbi:MAG: glycosyltransferase family 4 protein [Propionibacteriaceae bacterium]
MITSSLVVGTRIGLVCPYALDVPGGVQNHVLGLAGHLLRAGMDVQVLAPGTADPARLAAAGVPRDRVTSAGPTLPVPYNGSIARVNFGPRADSRVRRWFADHHLDLLHLHEPITPSISLLALRAATVPVVATFHTATPRSRTMQLAGTTLRHLVAKIDAGIAVSATARTVVVQHLGRDAVIIPNGFDHAGFAGRREPAARFWTSDDRPRLSYLGRLDEPRKGLDVLLSALPQLEAELGALDVAVAGLGRAALPKGCRRLGPIDDHDRAALLASSDVFVAPHRARESFGIVVIEAMTAGAVVVASGIPAFAALLGGPADHGRLGYTFPTGDSGALAGAVGAALAGDRTGIARRAAEATRRFDWSVVGCSVEGVYASVLACASERGTRTAAVLDDLLRRRAQTALTLAGQHGHHEVATTARRALDARTLDARTLDARTQDARTLDARTLDARALDAREAAEISLTLARADAGLDLGELTAELVLARRLHNDSAGPGARVEMIDEATVLRVPAISRVVTGRH